TSLRRAIRARDRHQRRARKGSWVVDMANQDLRDWIAGVEAAGELKHIRGAEPKEEIGGLVDIYIRRMGNPAVIFDEVPGYAKGPPAPANILASPRRANGARGLPPQSTQMEKFEGCGLYFRSGPPQPTRAVNGGPLLENVLEGKDVDIQKIPTPIWHEQDGGP